MAMALMAQSRARSAREKEAENTLRVPGVPSQIILDSAMDVDSSSPAQLERLSRGKKVECGEEREEGSEARPHDWHTFKYRPIMGVVLVGAGNEVGPEVAVVERPVWELGLPGRWEGEQEWRDQEVGL